MVGQCSAGLPPFYIPVLLSCVYPGPLIPLAWFCTCLGSCFLALPLLVTWYEIYLSKYHLTFNDGRP